MTRTAERLTSRGSPRTVASLLVAGAVALGISAAAEQAPPAVEAQQADDKTPASVTPREGCPDCRGADSARPDSSTLTTTGDGKTTLPKSLMRDQADFRLNQALRNVPGVNRR